MLRRLSGRYGKRGLWLIVLGTVWMVFGLGQLLEPNAPRAWVFYELFPVWVQAAAWLVTGGVALWQGWRGPHVDDSLGHVALYLMPAVRVVSFLLAWLIFLGSTLLTWMGVTDDVIGLANGWYAAGVWALISLMLALVASWPNPDMPIPRPPTRALDRG